MFFFRRVVGDSMKPTLRDGQIIFAHHVRSFKPGQVVVAHVGTREVIKRITDIDHKGQVYIEGDNPHQSTDSRQYGKIVDTNIAGVVIWPRVNRSI